MSKLIVLGSIAGAGITGVCGYAAYSMIQPSNVEETLIKNNFKLTSELNESERASAWSKVEGTYRVEATENNKIGDKSVSEATSKDIEDWCLKSLKIKIKDENYRSTYLKASKWCVTYTTIAERLKSENKQLSANEGSLKTKYNGMPADLKTVISNDNTDSTGSKTKKWCEDTSKRAFSGDNDKYYKNLITYCLTT